MGVETFGFIGDLVASNPLVGDDVAEGDDHLRGLKLSVQASLPHMGTAAWTMDSPGAAFDFYNMIAGTPLGALQLKSPLGAVVVETSEGGMVLEPAAAQAASIDVHANGASSRVVIRGDSGGISHRWLESSAKGQIGQTDPSGTYEESWIELHDNGGVELFHNGASRWEATSLGYEAAGNVFSHINPAATLLEFELRNSAGGVQIGVLNTSADTQISQTNSAGVVEDVWLNLVRNGRVQANYDNVKAFASTPNGLDVFPSSANTSAVVDVVCDNASQDSILRLRGVSNGGLQMYWDESASIAYIRQTAASGAVEDTWISLQKNGEVALRYNAAVKLQTRVDGVSVTGSLTSTVRGSSTTAIGTLETATTAEVKAGTDTTRAVTASGIAGTKSLAADGYYVFPGGLTLQWGTETGIIANSSRLFTYPRTITTHYSGLASYAETTDTDIGDACSFDHVSTTQGRVTNGDNNTQNINWMEFGLS